VQKTFNIDGHRPITSNHIDIPEITTDYVD
jgi:hypothetical protein